MSEPLIATLSQPVPVGIGIIVRNGEGQVLLGKRIADKHGKGEFSFPGGKPDPGEDPGYAAFRELYEETGLVAYGLTQVPTWTYDRYEDEQVHFVTIYFDCYADPRAEPRNMEPDKCEGWLWYDEDELPEPLFCGVREALEAT
jgi:8-oxo-dGTP diphosphatase